MSNTALLVVDAQESFRHRPYWTDADVPDFTAKLQKLIDGCAAREILILQVFHVESEGAFSLKSGWVTTFEPIRIKPDAVFHKHYHSALVGSSLGPWLTEHGIRRLIVSGIRTEECCETTTRHASDSGFAVDFVSEATLTFPIKHARTGSTYGAAEIKERTEAVLLNGGFASISSVEELLREL